MHVQFVIFRWRHSIKNVCTSHGGVADCLYVVINGGLVLRHEFWIRGFLLGAAALLRTYSRHRAAMPVVCTWSSAGGCS
eukprot:1157065-Pelagomonas_calceolata.AAC.2